MTTSVSMEDFEALLNESLELETPKEGSVVKGTIIAIEAGQAIIDIGYKMEGRVEFLDHSKLPEGYQPLNREWYDKMCRLYKIANPYPAEVGDFKSKGEVGSKKD